VIGITDISLAEGVTYKGEKTVPLEAGYLPGTNYKMTMENYKSWCEVFTMIKAVYMNRIIPLFGEFGRWYSD
jgi:hypothetical protein